MSNPIGSCSTTGTVSIQSELDPALKAMDLKILKTPFQAPQANASCERLISTVRRRCLDFLIPLNERHLRSLLISRSGSHTTIGAGHIRVSDRASPTYVPASSRPNGADTAFRLITKLWPRRSWVDSITNTVWKDVRLDFLEEKCS